MNKRAMIVIGSVLLAGCASKPKEEPLEPAPMPIDVHLGEDVAEPLSRGWTDPSGLVADGPVLVGGRPDPAGLVRFATGGGELVIDMLTDDEQTYEVGYDEAALVESLGLDYERLVVPGPDAFGADQVLRLAELISLARGGVLLHSLNGNRAAGLWAAYLVLIEKEGVDESVEVARVMGMNEEPTEARVRALARAAGG